MSDYTYRITTDETTGAVTAWVDVDGMQAFVQPHHPSAVNGEPWASAADAEAWAVEFCAALKAEEEQMAAAAAAAEAEAAAVAAAAQEDRDRLARIESKLDQLLGL